MIAYSSNTVPPDLYDTFGILFCKKDIKSVTLANFQLDPPNSFGSLGGRSWFPVIFPNDSYIEQHEYAACDKCRCRQMKAQVIVKDGVICTHFVNQSLQRNSS